MSPLEIVLYIIMGGCCVGLFLKWFVYDPWRKRHPKKDRVNLKEQEENEDDL